eukprot:201947-Chlamydomonas_euryale.AAC.2
MLTAMLPTAPATIPQAHHSPPREEIKAHGPPHAALQPYAPSPASGTREVALRSDAFDRLVATLRATPRMARELALGAAAIARLASNGGAAAVATAAAACRGGGAGLPPRPRG